MTKGITTALVLIAIAVLRPGNAVSQTPGGGAVLTITHASIQPGAATVPPFPVMLLKEGFGEALKKKGMSIAEWVDACGKGAPTCKSALESLEPIFIDAKPVAANAPATFEPVPPGIYYVFHYLLTVGAPATQSNLWDVKLDLKPGRNAVTLDQRNATALNAGAAPPRTAAGAAPSSGNAVATAASVAAPPAPPRPAGPKNAVLSLEAISESRTPMPRTMFYLLDDDFEVILTRAGFKPQMLLGKELPLLSSFELVNRWHAMKDSPGFSLLAGFGGGNPLEEIEEPYAIATKALAEHTVGSVRTDIYGKANLPAVPAGNYYVFGTANESVTTGARGTITGSTVTLTPNTYEKATIWNLKVPLKAGQNSVVLTPDNAAFEGN